MGPEEPAPPEAAPPRWPWIAGGAGVAALLAVLALGVPGRDSGRGELEEGIALFRSGDRARAAALFRRYADDHPEDVTSRLYLARIQRRAGEREQAAETLREVSATAPDDPGLHRELGWLLLDAGWAEAAVDHFRSAVELDPESTAGWVGLIRALRADGRAEAAERILARAPDRVRTLLRPAPLPSRN